MKSEEANDYYVYVYIDPRNMRDFYYGKGKGERKSSHLHNTTGDSEKDKIINEIRKTGDEPIVRVIVKDLTEQEAYLVEAAFIWKLGHQLSNEFSGHFKDKFRDKDSLNRNLSGFDFKNEVHFINVGEGEHRCWEASYRHGFIAASQGPQYKRQITQVNKGDVVVAYLSKHGYVGLGVAQDRALLIKDFAYQRSLTKKDFLREKCFENFDNPELSEYCVPLEWVSKKRRKEAIPQKRIGYHHIGIRMSLSGRPETLQKLEDAFGVKFDELLLEDSKAAS